MLTVACNKLVDQEPQRDVYQTLSVAEIPSASCNLMCQAGHEFHNHLETSAPTFANQRKKRSTSEPV